MNDLKELHYCLGVEFERNREAYTITMNQRNYIKEVLKRLNMEECKLVGTPFDANANLFKLSDENFENVQRKLESVSYKTKVESPMYATVDTRADLAFAVSMVSHFMANANSPHWMVVKRIIRYILQ